MVKILIIEDNIELQGNISEALQMEGYEVIHASDGRTGIKLAQEFMPDLILCDILMPGMDGFEVLKQLKQADGILPVPFIFITALAERQNFRAGMELGADDYLVKPFTLDELFNAVKARLSKQNSFENKVRAQIEAIENELSFQILELKKQNDIQKLLIHDLGAANDAVTGELNEKQELLLRETLRSIEINSTLQNLAKQLHTELSKPGISDEERKVLIDLRNKISNRSLLLDSWTVFQLKFNQTYPNFASQLTVQFPQLSQQDMVIVFATLLNLNTHQISIILSISPDSVRKSKYRLKKKLGLGIDDDLMKFIHNMNIYQN